MGFSKAFLSRKGFEMSRILIVRMRGEIGTLRDVIDTFKMLGMKKMYSFTLVENNSHTIGMIRKIDNFVSWGEPDAETEKILEELGKRGKSYVSGGLKSPKGGFKSKKLRYPRGNLGYCGAAINDMVRRML